MKINISYKDSATLATLGMKQLAIITSFVLCSVIAYSGNNNNNDDNCEDSKSCINQKVNGKKHGKWVKYYRDGSVKQEGHYVKGKRDGMWKFYSKDGEYYDLGELDMGKKTGWWYLVKASTGEKLEALRFDGRGNTVDYKNLKAQKQ